MKKSLLFVVIVLCLSLNVFSQDENIPAPDFVNTLYSITKDGLVSLEKQEASIKSRLKIGTFIPYANLFAGGTKSSLIIKEAKSNVRFNGNKLRFIYEPSVMVDPETTVKIIPFTSNESKNQREVFTGSSNTWGTAKANEIPKIPFTFKKYKEKYIIIELNNLPQGEYGIVFSSKDASNAELKMQLFGVY
jgi:hypothetical protein